MTTITASIVEEVVSASITQEAVSAQIVQENVTASVGSDTVNASITENVVNVTLDGAQDLSTYRQFGLNVGDFSETVAYREITTEETKTITVGASGYDYTTVQEAVNQIPLVVRHPLTIEIYDGTYAEDVFIPPFSVSRLHATEGAIIGVTIEGKGSPTTDVKVKSFIGASIVGTHALYIKNLEINGIDGYSDENTSASFYGCNSVLMTGVTFTATTDHGFMAYNSNVYVHGLVYSGTYQYACLSKNMSNIILGDTGGTAISGAIGGALVKNGKGSKISVFNISATYPKLLSNVSTGITYDGINDKLYSALNEIAHSADTVSDLSTFDTDDLTEGVTNLYDKTVVLTPGTNITSITGTYPNFTINADNQTTDISGKVDVAGDTMTGDLNVPDEVYGVGWNGSTEVPTKNAVYDKIETLGGTTQYIVACSGEKQVISVDTDVATFNAHADMTLTDLKANLQTASVGTGVTIDVNVNGSSILSTKLTIDVTEKTSRTAATAHVFSSTTINEDDIITIDIDAVGSTTPGKGLKVTFYGDVD